VPSAIELTQGQLQHAFATLADNVRGLTLDEALFIPSGGFRSILGTLKHAAGWSHVYRSYAFESSPRHWPQIDWPRGLRDTIETSQAYLDEVVAWLDTSHQLWLRDLSALSVKDLWLPRPVHWGDTMPLHKIVTLIACHHAYHAGELNQLLSIARGEAWEEGEEVEENNVSTLGHRVRPAWMG
jgi:uncharacterized damage-inducible protein DinB